MLAGQVKLEAPPQAITTGPDALSQAENSDRQNNIKKTFFTWGDVTFLWAPRLENFLAICRDFPSF